MASPGDPYHHDAPAAVGHYRLNVGIMLLNPDGLVFIGQRRLKRAPDTNGETYLWQMPQGGIDPGEAPYDAALRELREETNVTSVVKLAEAPDWYTYDLPVDLHKKTWRGRYQGQRQKWFALRFTGDESEIDVLSPAGGVKPEFERWRWERMESLPDLIIPFKRPVYEKVIEAFATFAAR
jgi:putative (di)nucleoside polyphosphate hydrolase